MRIMKRPGPWVAAAFATRKLTKPSSEVENAMKYLEEEKLGKVTRAKTNDNRNETMVLFKVRYLITD